MEQMDRLKQLFGERENPLLYDLERWRVALMLEDIKSLTSYLIKSDKVDPKTPIGESYKPDGWIIDYYLDGSTDEYSRDGEIKHSNWYDTFGKKGHTKSIKKTR